MDNYNTSNTKGYSLNSRGYEDSQSSLPIYNTSSKRSKCPKGAALGRIGSSCGDRCARACLISDD